MLTTPFIFSIQIVERAYKNKNGGGFIHCTALSGLFARCRIVEKRKTSVGRLNHLFLDQNYMNSLFRDFHALFETRLLNNHSLHSRKKRDSYILAYPPPPRIMTHIFFIKCCSSFSASSRCTEYTVFEKDCSKTCSNVGGQVKATEWCPSYSTVPANRKLKRTKTVQCKDYCSGKLAELDDLVTKYC